LALVPAPLLLMVTACGDRGQSPAADWDTPVVVGPDPATAEAMYWRGEYDSAGTIWSVAIGRARSSNDAPAEARVLTWQGLAAWRLGDYAAAQQLGEAALSLKLRYQLKSELFRSYNALGLLAWNQGKLLDALNLLQSASSAALAAGDADGIAKAAGNLALIQTELGDFAAARSGFLTMLEAARALDDIRVEGNALTNLGMLDIRIGDPSAAIPHLVQARRLYRDVGYGAGEVSAMGQLGVAHQGTGELQLALAVLDSALQLSRSLQLRQEEASNLEALASLHQVVGDWRGALRLYAQAQKLNGDLGLSIEQGADLRQEAEIHLELGETEMAQRKVSQALTLHRAAKSRVEELQDRILLAELAQRNEQPIIAREHLRLAGQLAARTGARTSKVEAALAAARFSLRAGEHRASLRALAEAHSNLAPGDFVLESQVHTGRAESLRRLGKLDSAAVSGHAAVQALERVRGSLGSGTLRAAFLASKVAGYAQLVEILIERGDLESAFEVADAARGRALVEHLASAGSSARERPVLQTLGSADGLLRRAEALAAELVELDDTPAPDRDASWQVMRRYLTDQLEQVRSSLEVLLLHADAGDVPALQLLNAGGTNYSSVTASLRPDEALLEYLVGPGRVHLFLVTTYGIRHFAISLTPQDLSSRTRLARELMARPVRGPPAPVLTALYDLLIRPALESDELKGVRRLLIAPHGSLAYLPFAALHDGESGRYLAQDFALVALPSAAALPILRTGRPADVNSPPWGATVLAPYPEGLPATRIESKAFVQSVKGARSRMGGRATERALREALGTPGLVHLATHGRMNPANPMFSRLDIAAGEPGDSKDDGKLEVHELLGLTIRSSLVFLSGCETGVGAAWSNRYRPGEDYATLSQAFLFAGAGSVIATLWPIADAGAATFAERFYHHLHREAPPEALASAQRDLLQTPHYGAPYYWAAYQITGPGELELRTTAQK
jgi:CHAT domain-containing protein/tetratricopeptide (TPR) repeat protein